MKNITLFRRWKSFEYHWTVLIGGNVFPTVVKQYCSTSETPPPPLTYFPFSIKIRLILFPFFHVFTQQFPTLKVLYRICSDVEFWKRNCSCTLLGQSRRIGGLSTQRFHCTVALLVARDATTSIQPRSDSTAPGGKLRNQDRIEHKPTRKVIILKTLVYSGVCTPF